MSLLSLLSPSFATCACTSRASRPRCPLKYLLRYICDEERSPYLLFRPSLTPPALLKYCIIAPHHHHHHYHLGMTRNHSFVFSITKLPGALLEDQVSSHYEHEIALAFLLEDEGTDSIDCLVYPFGSSHSPDLRFLYVIFECLKKTKHAPISIDLLGTSKVSFLPTWLML